MDEVINGIDGILDEVDSAINKAKKIRDLVYKYIEVVKKYLKKRHKKKDSRSGVLFIKLQNEPDELSLRVLLYNHNIDVDIQGDIGDINKYIDRYPFLRDLEQVANFYFIKNLVSALVFIDSIRSGRILKEIDKLKRRYKGLNSSLESVLRGVEEVVSRAIIVDELKGDE